MRTRAGFRALTSCQLPTALAMVALLTGLMIAGTARAQSCSSSQHQLTFTNNCKYPLWLAENATPEVEPGNWELAASCKKNSQCAAGQTCNTQTAQCTCATNADCGGATCSGGLCQNSESLCMPIGWNGRFWPRTNCVFSACTTDSDCSSPYNTCYNGQCVYSGCSSNLDCQNLTAPPYQNNPNDQCTNGMCFVADNGPLPNNGGLCQTGDCNGHLDCGAANLTANGATLIEATMEGNSAVDNYDVSLVSGYNVPAAVSLPNTNNPCTLQGVTFSGNGGCVADLNAVCPAPLQVYVNPPGGGSCTKTSRCPAGSTCNVKTGTCVIACLHPSVACLAANPVAALDCTDNNGLYTCDTPNESCNKGAAVCFTDKKTQNVDCPPGLTCDTTASDFGLNPNLPSGGGVCNPPAGANIPACNGTDGSLGMDCSSIASGAATGYTCNSLANEGLCLPPTSTSPSDSCCGAANSAWISAAVTAGGGKTPYYDYFKTACPVAYSFQYDDPTSNPFCTNPASSLLSYQVTFCPVAAKATRGHKQKKPKSHPHGTTVEASAG